MKRTINAIIIHCAATPNGKPYDAAAINQMHKARGFKRDSQRVRSFNPELPNIGYHYVIGIDGHVYTGRSLEEIGAHVQGSNAKSIGVCMIGTDKFTEAQWKSLRELMTDLSNAISGKDFEEEKALLRLKEMGITIKGHRDYSPDLNGDGIIQRNEWIKTCPGFDVAGWIAGGMTPVITSLMTGVK
jgi:hypothetical protein